MCCVATPALRGPLLRPGPHAADYRLWYLRRKGELDARTAAARSKIAAAYELEQAKKDSRKAKVCVCGGGQAGWPLPGLYLYLSVAGARGVSGLKGWGKVQG